MSTRRRGQRRAFTLLEVLIAVAVIVILAGILFVGFRSIQESNRRKSTQVTLENLRGMLTEFDTATRLGRRPNVWLWRGVPIADPTDSSFDDMGLDFWKVQMRDSNAADADETPADVPGLVNQDAPLNRNAARMVINTSLAMQQLASIPANRSMLQQIPAELHFTPDWVSGSVPMPGDDDVLGTDDDGTPQDIYYLAGVRVKVDERSFRCTANQAAGSGATSPPAGSWVEEPDNAPLLLDAWGNPILLVPGTGTRVIINVQDDDTTLETADGEQIIDIQSPDRRPFFISAGPDGNFWKGDDNLYSFEN